LLLTFAAGRLDAAWALKLSRMAKGKAPLLHCPKEFWLSICRLDMAQDPSAMKKKGAIRYYVQRHRFIRKCYCQLTSTLS